ncbi:hypothetical protein WA026_019040 [Henosepilachna vigintioctopunctata]|uniref:Uncharacterized protein n=1 Tax=Henosepilachna vigintioctopunctata TaxID=420089 RepID=A0AAW1VFI5_9CUCU
MTVSRGAAGKLTVTLNSNICNGHSILCLSFIKNQILEKRRGASPKKSQYNSIRKILSSIIRILKPTKQVNGFERSNILAKVRNQGSENVNKVSYGYHRYKVNTANIRHPQGLVAPVHKQLQGPSDLAVCRIRRSPKEEIQV